jgi:dihydrodipicolinate synthase/N-acetylneuraminate lyase
MLMDGLHVPVTAPFDRDGRSTLRKLEHNVARYSLTPAAGLVALTGEGAALSDVERRETLETIGRTAAAEKVLVANVSAESVRSALAIADEAAGAGFDALMLSAPACWASLREAEQMLWFLSIADGSPLPVMLSSDASGVCLPVAQIGELAQHPNVVGSYEAELSVGRLRAIQAATQGVSRAVTVTPVFAPVTGRMLAQQGEGVAPSSFVSAASLSGGTAVVVAPSRPAMKTRSKTVGFQVMAAGGVKGIVELLEAGAAGVCPAMAPCTPQVCYEAYAAFKDGDPALASEKEQRLFEADALLRELGIAAIKHGCDLNGYYGGAPRLPRLPLLAEARAEVERVLAGLKN